MSVRWSSNTEDSFARRFRPARWLERWFARLRSDDPAADDPTCCDPNS